MIQPARSSRPSHERWRALVVLALGVILTLTLWPGDPVRAEHTPLWCLVCGSRGVLDVALNVLLFLPYGVALRGAGHSLGRAVAIGTLTSLCIETLQLLVIPGRDPTLSDILTNSAGTLAGALAAGGLPSLLFPEARLARGLVAATLLAWAGTLAGTGWALQPHMPAGVGYWTQPVPGPTNPSFSAPTGARRDARLNGVPLAQAQVARPATLRSALAADSLTASVQERGGHATERIQPLVWISTLDSRTLLLLGRHEDDLVLTRRLRAEALRLHGLRVRLPDAFSGAADDASWRTLRAAITPGGRIALESRDGHMARSVDVALSPGHGWAVLWPFGVLLTPAHALVNGLWLGLLAAPLGYWSRRAGGPHRPGHPIRWWLLTGVLAAVILLAAARLFALAGPLPGDWLGLVGGFTGGWVASRLIGTVRSPVDRPGLATPVAHRQHWPS